MEEESQVPPSELAPDGQQGDLGAPRHQFTLQMVTIMASWHPRVDGVLAESPQALLPASFTPAVLVSSEGEWCVLNSH